LFNHSKKKLSQLPVTQSDVNIDVSEPLVLFVSYHPNSLSFSLNVNGEAVDDYAIVNKDPGMSIVRATVDGALSVNYFGFTKPGDNPTKSYK
jgi:hypothetical protein